MASVCVNPNHSNAATTGRQYGQAGAMTFSKTTREIICEQSGHRRVFLTLLTVILLSGLDRCPKTKKLTPSKKQMRSSSTSSSSREFLVTQARVSEFYGNLSPELKPYSFINEEIVLLLLQDCQCFSNRSLVSLES